MAKGPAVNRRPDEARADSEHLRAAAPAPRAWRPRFGLKTLLIAMLWLASLLGAYRFGFDGGRRMERRAGWKETSLVGNSVQVYYVGHLLEQYTPNELLAQIKATAPGTWDHEGGPGSLSYHDTNESVVVSQTSKSQDEVGRLFDRLHKATPLAAD